MAMLGQEPGVAEMAAQYLAIAGPGIIPALVVMVLKSYLAALERTQVVLWITLAAVAANAVINYALIFGHWGAPEMGIRGSAIASLAVQVISVIALAVYVALATPEHALFARVWRPDWEALGQVFRLGWPIGLTSLAEVGLFAASSVMMGWLGEVPLAAHGIALQLASLTFMVHLGLSNVATVRAGRALGRGDRDELRRGAQVVVAMSVIMAVAAVAVFVALPGPLVALFLDPADPKRDAVLEIGAVLMLAAALFQLVDAAQVMALGLLRGVQDTRVPMVMAAVAYWAIGIPVSYWLGFGLGLGGVGIWLGLAVGLALAAGLLMARFWTRAIGAAFAGAAPGVSGAV
jgi:MATE family multidrug resistance protein